MCDIHTPQKTAHGWVVTIPAAMIQLLGVAAGPRTLLTVREHRLEVDILLPPSPELRAEIRSTYEELQDTFAALKRCGD